MPRFPKSRAFNSHGRSFHASILVLHPRFSTTLLADQVDVDRRAYRIERSGTYRLKVVIPDVEAGCTFRVVAGYP